MKNLMINWGLLLNYLINYWKARIMLYDVIWSGYGSTLVDTKIGGIWMFIPPKYINILVLDGSGTSPIIPIHLMTWELFQGKKQQCRKLSTKASTSEWTLTLCTETLGTWDISQPPRISRSIHPPHRFQWSKWRNINPILDTNSTHAFFRGVEKSTYIDRFISHHISH